MTPAKDTERMEEKKAPAACTSSPLGNPSELQSHRSTSRAVHSGVRSQDDASNETVRLVSSEGKYLDVPVHIAKECELLERMLSGSFAEGRTREISLPNITYRTLCKVIDYLLRRCQWREGGGAPLEFEVDDEAAIDLLIAADYLGMK